MLVRLEAYGVTVVCNVENVAYSGEVLRDMLTRACDGLQRGLAIVAEYEDADDEADADGE